MTRPIRNLNEPVVDYRTPGELAERIDFEVEQVATA